MEKIIDKNIKNNLAVQAEYLNYFTDNERNALIELKEKIMEKYPDSQIILYGSKARGDAGVDSDIDILIVINDNYNIDKDISFEELERHYFLPVDKGIEDEISNILVDIQVKYCVSIDYQIKNKSYINTNLAGIVPLYQNIKKEGVKL